MSKESTIDLFKDLQRRVTPLQAMERGLPTKIKEGYKKRTFEIAEVSWQDFMLLVKADDITINDYINKLIKTEVDQNRDFIESIRERRRR